MYTDHPCRINDVHFGRDPQDAEDVRQAEIDERANEIEESLSDAEWLADLDSALTQHCYISPRQSVGEHHPGKASELRKFRDAVTCRKGDEVIEFLTRILREQAVSRAEEQLCD